MKIDAEFIANNDYFDVIEPVWDAVSIYDGPDQYKADLASFSDSQRFLVACHWCTSEVNNGGLYQFYSNSTGIVWADALEGFRAVGLLELADIIEESAKRLGGAPSFYREDRERALYELKPEFEDLDDRFYKFEREVSIDSALTDYMRQHAEEFEYPRPLGTDGA